MIMDVYNCEDCGRAFAVEKDDEPTCCPVCEAEIWEYSHTVKCELVKE
jgi:DNA-directed RNA polymerase subunit RPC12/RpoP